MDNSTILENVCKHINSNVSFKQDRSYANTWLELGYSDQEVDERVRQIYSDFLHNPAYGCALQMAEDELVFYDTGNIDVRTEGQSYGMLLAVMLDDKTVFDNTWRWTIRNMYINEGYHRGYFAWSVPLDERPKATGPAPDGEEFFIWSLILADKKWGSGEGELDYKTWAKQILKDVLHRNKGESGPMWEAINLIEFVPNAGFSDPSYHIPHAYALFSEYAEEEDQARWLDIAEASRVYLQKAVHPETGLFPEYALYSGEPEQTRGFSTFFSDAYRCMLNIAADAKLHTKEAWHEEIARNQSRFFVSQGEKSVWYDYTIAGEKTGRDALHPLGLLATVACTRSVVDTEESSTLAKAFWNSEMRIGDRRYFDNFLYIFCFLLLSGKYTY